VYYWGLQRFFRLFSKFIDHFPPEIKTDKRNSSSGNFTTTHTMAVESNLGPIKVTLRSIDAGELRFMRIIDEIAAAIQGLDAMCFLYGDGCTHSDAL
jgi:hypothetical protein